MPGRFERSRRQSVPDFVEVDFRFAAGGFAERDDADFMVVFRVDDADGDIVEEPERDVAPLAVAEPSSSNVNVTPSNTSTASKKSRPWTNRFEVRLASDQVNSIS
jgi:hypothetical protein